MEDKEFLQDPNSEETLDGFSLEDILKEFGDETEPVAEKTPEEILSHPADDYVKQFVIDNLKTKIDSLAKYQGYVREEVAV